MVRIIKISPTEFLLISKNSVTITFKISTELYERSVNIKDKSSKLRYLIKLLLNGKLDISGMKPEILQKGSIKTQSLIVENEIKKELQKRALEQGLSINELMNILYQYMVANYAHHL